MDYLCLTALRTKQGITVSFEPYQLDVIWLVISGLFILSLLIQLFYYLFFFIRMALFRCHDDLTSSGEPVSVVICARNEADNLEKNLPVIMEQDYGDYEVIVVNDSSEDNTEEVLDRFKKRYKNLKSTIIRKDKKFRHGKKLAVTIGLKAASHNWVLLTDADCRPASPLWISLMQRHFVSPTEVILGYGGYERCSGLLDKFVRLDTLFIAMQYFSFALAGYPYMGVGRNLAYRRSLFFSIKGFASHLKLESGDDDLFINEVAKRENTAVEFSHLAHTCSVSPADWSAWLRQKRRHLTTGFHYRWSTRFLLGPEIFSRLLFYATFLLLILNKILIPYVIGIYLIRLAINTVILNKVMNRLNEKNLLVFSPIFDLIIILLNIFCAASNLISQKRSRWR